MKEREEIRGDKKVTVFEREKNSEEQSQAALIEMQEHLKKQGFKPVHDLSEKPSK